MIRSNLARSRATAMSCQSSGLVQSYPLPVRGPDQPSRPNPAWGLNAQNHIRCIFVIAAPAPRRAQVEIGPLPAAQTTTPALRGIFDAPYEEPRSTEERPDGDHRFPGSRL